MAIAAQTMVDNITAAINKIVGDGTVKAVQNYRIGDTSYEYLSLADLQDMLVYWTGKLREEVRPTGGRRSVVAFRRP